MCIGCGCRCKDVVDAEWGDDSSTELHPCKRCMLTPCVTHICIGVRKSDYLKHCNCYPPAIFIPAITIVQIAIFAAYVVELAGTSNPVTATTGYPRNSPLVYLPTRRYEAWRYLTYMFIHQGYEHLIGNMLLQLFVGLSLEMIHKWWRVMIVYLCGVIAGSLLHSMIEHDLALVGASAGSFALVGAHLAVVITNWKQMRVRCECSCKCLPRHMDRTVSTAPIRLVVVLPLVLHEFGRAIYKHVVSHEDWRIAVGAHIGGVLAGIVHTTHTVFDNNYVYHNHSQEHVKPFLDAGTGVKTSSTLHIDFIFYVNISSSDIRDRKRTIFYQMYLGFLITGSVNMTGLV